VGTSIRHGCKSVTQLEIMPAAPETRQPDNPWPQWPKVLKVDYGQEESIAVFGRDPRTYEITAKRFVGDEDGHVKEVHTVLVNWCKDDKGRFIPQEVPAAKRWAGGACLLARAFWGRRIPCPRAFPWTGHKVQRQSGLRRLSNLREGVFAAAICAGGEPGRLGHQRRRGAARNAQVSEGTPFAVI
jgi:NADPH-dependent glutamate synthase beta subunit-like oxidoreductase